MSSKKKVAIGIVALLMCASIGVTGIFLDASFCEVRENTIVTNKGTNNIVFVLIVTTNDTRDSWLYVTPSIYEQYAINETYGETICKNRFVANAEIISDSLNFEETLAP